MFRASCLTAVLLLLSWNNLASAFDPYDPAVKKLMPKDQLEIFEKIEDLCKQDHEQFFRIKDRKKRDEEAERLGGQARQLYELIGQKVKTEGLKGWVATAYVILPDVAIACDGWQTIRLNLKLRDRNEKGKIEDAMNAIRPNDIIRFSTKPDPTYVMPKALGKTIYGYDQHIRIETITSVEKIGTKTLPAKKTPAEKKKN